MLPNNPILTVEAIGTFTGLTLETFLNYTAILLYGAVINLTTVQIVASLLGKAVLLPIHKAVANTSFP